MNIESPRRLYRQSARARAAAATGERILAAFAAEFGARWFDEIRLDDVARSAGVTTQTVIRRFGGKEGLLDAMHQRLGEEIVRRREVAPGDADAALDALVRDYEEVGDLVLRSLAQEERHPSVKAITDIGRQHHHAWIMSAFEPWLGALPAEDRRKTTDALVVAGDIYVWKLVRRDMRRPINEYRALVETLSAAALNQARELIFPNPHTGESQ